MRLNRRSHFWCFGLRLLSLLRGFRDTLCISLPFPSRPSSTILNLHPQFFLKLFLLSKFFSFLLGQLPLLSRCSLSALPRSKTKGLPFLSKAQSKVFSLVQTWVSHRSLFLSSGSNQPSTQFECLLLSSPYSLRFHFLRSPIVSLILKFYSQALEFPV